jgi:hypothetical protein
MVNVLICDRVHDRAHGILSDRGDGRHVRWLTFVALIAQVVSQLLHALVLPRFQKLAKMLAPDVSEERYEVRESLVCFLYHQVQI